MNMFQMATVTNPVKNGLLVIGGYSEVKWNHDYEVLVNISTLFEPWVSIFQNKFSTTYNQIKNA